MANCAATPQVTVEQGTKLERYELLCHLARGGMANVWLGRLHSKPEFEKLFAIKTILPSEADTEGSGRCSSTRPVWCLASSIPTSYA